MLLRSFFVWCILPLLATTVASAQFIQLPRGLVLPEILLLLGLKQPVPGDHQAAGDRIADTTIYAALDRCFPGPAKYRDSLINARYKIDADAFSRLQRNLRNGTLRQPDSDSHRSIWYTFDTPFRYELLLLIYDLQRNSCPYILRLRYDSGNLLTAVSYAGNDNFLFRVRPRQVRNAKTVNFDAYRIIPPQTSGGIQLMGATTVERNAIRISVNDRTGRIHVIR